MNITTRMKQIDGVTNAAYNFDAMTLAIYYKATANLELLKIRVAKEIGTAMLQNAIPTINFYSEEP